MDNRGVDWIFAVVATAHVGLAGVWLGAMLYSLLIVQPRATRFLGPDDDMLEAFLTQLGAGNRRPVLAIIVALAITWAAMPVLREPAPTDVVLYAAEAAFLVAAAATFANVTWRLWPARVFALPHERQAFRRSFRKSALTMAALVSATFVVAVLNLSV